MRFVMLLPFYVFCIVFLSFTCFGQSYISELMYAPNSGNEWIELYVLEDINISKLVLQDNLNADEIICCEFFNNSCSDLLFAKTYYLIFEQDANFSNMIKYDIDHSKVYCVDDNSIGNGLGNEEDNLTLLVDGNVEDNIIYSKNNGASKNGFSLSRLNSTLIETYPSPGRENNFTHIFWESNEVTNISRFEIIVYIEETVFANILYTSLFKIDNNGEPKQVEVNYYLEKDGMTAFTGNFSAFINSYKYANTGYLKFNNSGDYTLCGTVLQNNVTVCKNIKVIDLSSISCNVSIKSFLDRQIYNNGEKINLSFFINNETYPYFIEYWVEDLFGNKVKNKINTSNSNTKTFTPNIKENDQILFFNSKLYTFCNNTQESIINKIMFGVKKIIFNDSTLNIESVSLGSDEIARFGEDIKANVKIYKGNSTKNNVKFYIENSKNERVSKISSINVYDNFKEYDFSTYVKLDDNCNDKFADGKYYFVAQGLGEHEKTKINIQGKVASHCPKTSSKTSSSKPVVNRIESLIYEYEIPTKITNNLKINFSIINNDAIEHNVRVYSYIYRGNKCYSGEREDNIIETKLLGNSKSSIVLNNDFLDQADDGEYKVKIKIFEDDKITPKEITQTVQVKKIVDVNKINENINLMKNMDYKIYNDLEIPKLTNSITGNLVEETIYESKNVLMKKSTSMIFLGIIALTSIVVIFKKKDI